MDVSSAELVKASHAETVNTHRGFALFLIRNRWNILGTAVLFAAATAISMALLVPRKYPASATLVMVSPKISSELKPTSLTVQGYQKLLEADAIIEETRQELVKRGVVLPTDLLRLRDDLETRIFVSRYSETTTLAPMIQLIADGKTSADATLIANTWAEVFLRRVRELTLGSTTAQVKFVDEQYPKSQERLMKSEGERMAAAVDLSRKLDEVTREWDGKVLRMKNATTEVVSVHKAETKHLIEEFAGANNMSTRRGQLQALRKAYFELQIEQTQINSRQQREKLRLEAARKYLGEVSTFVTIRKAITDEALWQSLVTADGKEPDWKQLQTKSLITQVVNPVYTNLAERVSQLEVDERAMSSSAKQMEEELRHIDSKIKSLDIALRVDESKLDRLTSDRESELEKLQDKRATELADLMRERQLNIAASIMERDVRLAQLDRAVAQEKELNTELSKNFNQAILAKAQQSTEEMRLGAPAVPVDRARPRYLAATSVLAGLVGAFLGAGIALVRSWAGTLHQNA